MAKKCLMEKSARLWAEKAKDAKRVAEGKKPLTKSNVRAHSAAFVDTQANGNPYALARLAMACW